LIDTTLLAKKRKISRVCYNLAETNQQFQNKMQSSLNNKLERQTIEEMQDRLGKALSLENKGVVGS
jgi:hypothetical protein